VLKLLSMNTHFSRKCLSDESHMLSFDNKVQSVAVSAKHLYPFQLEGKTVFEWTVISHKMWVRYFAQEPKESSTEWHHKGSPPTKIFKAQHSAGKNNQVRFVINRDWFLLIFLLMVYQLLNKFAVTCFAVMWTDQSRWKGLWNYQRSSTCMTMLVHTQQIWWRQRL
jgi:hypothetical protein